ncbi:MAG: V-type ATP synthase subunit I [Firmicutes bacterium]|nr:V-type ATP synthase subunit I [Bacillota bacterium]
MSIAKTKLVNITAELEYLDRVLSRFVDLDCIHPVPSNQIVDRVHGLTSFTSENPCINILNEISEIEQEYQFVIENVVVCSIDDSFEMMRSYVSSTHRQLQNYVMQKKDTLELIRKYQDALIQIKNIEDLDIPLDEVFSCEYVYARVGRLPTDSVEKLRFYRNRPFIFISFHEDKNYSWCMYFTTNEYEREVDNIFSSLFFERIHIPDFVHGTPEAAEVTLAKEIEVANQQLDYIQEFTHQLLTESAAQLSVIKAELQLMNKIYDAKQYVVGLGDKFTITGFVEPEDEPFVLSKFEDMKNVEVLIRPAGSDKRLIPPTKLKNGWFSRPFSMFVEMYGLPNYGGIDPTPFLALSYALLFGIMFGDLGQGLVLILIGFILAKWKKMKLGEVGIRIGISSSIFGFLYGSFFGNETILTPIFTNILGLTRKPIEVMDPAFTMSLLIFAISIGALLIITSIILNIYVNFKKKSYAEMFLSHNGVAGLVFYVYLFIGLILTMQFGIPAFSTVTIILLAVLPMLLVFFKDPLERLMDGRRMFPKGFGGFFTEGFFELFEVLLSYVTNTMSFLRVGGFVLAHAGLMLVVYTLMSMGGSAFATALIFIIGNLVVMTMEILIVGIQVLRLEFYEMFSRYYEGEGIPFKSFH